MALGAARAAGAELAIAVTGIAGPGGGSPGKPVGTVWLAVALAGALASSRLMLPGSRADIRARAAQAALFFALQVLRAAPPDP
jgi:nicotinamide-nucleotide amidase